MAKKKLNKGTLLIVIGSLLITGSSIFLLSIYFKLEDKKSEAIKLEKMLEEKVQAVEAVEETIGEAATTRENKIESLDDYGKEADELLDSKTIGVVRIDKINVVIPIFDNTDSKSLLEGAGLVEDTDIPSSLPNTISVLASHRGGRGEYLTFLNIHKLKNGDEIKITTKDQVLYYEVVGEEVIDAYNWDRFIKEEDKTKLYLMTCLLDPKDDRRLLIKTELVRYIDNE